MLKIENLARNVSSIVSAAADLHIGGLNVYFKILNVWLKQYSPAWKKLAVHLVKLQIKFLVTLVSSKSNIMSPKLIKKTSLKQFF